MSQLDTEPRLRSALTDARVTPRPTPPRQSAALRLMRDTGATLSAADIDRNVTAHAGNVNRPTLIAECGYRDYEGTSLPVSSQAPWFRSFGGSNAAMTNGALSKARAGAGGEFSQDATGALSACIGLHEKLTHGAARALVVDGSWQPGPEAVDAMLGGCALQYAASPGYVSDNERVNATNVCAEERVDLSRAQLTGDSDRPSCGTGQPGMYVWMDG